MMKRAIFWVLTFLLAASPVLADSQGSATGGTAGTQSTLAGGIYKASPPTLTDGQQTGLQTDANGQLKVTVSGGGSNACASATGSAVPSAACANGLNVGGTLRGQTGSNPTGTTYSAHTDTTSVNGVTTSTGAGAVGTGSQRIAVGQDATTIAGSAPGTAGTPGTAVVSVQGVTGGTVLPIVAADGQITNLGTSTDAASCASGTSSLACFRQMDADIKGTGTVQGTAASGSSVSGNPLLEGGRAATAAPTAVTDGQAIAKQLTAEGRTVTAPYSIKELMVRGTATSTDTSAHTIIASAGGSLKNYITAVQCGRTDAGSSALTITFNDSASTVVILPAGGATNITFPTPLATAAATAFQFTFGTGVTTGYCSAQGYTGL